MPFWELSVTSSVLWLLQNFPTAGDTHLHKYNFWHRYKLMLSCNFHTPSIMHLKGFWEDGVTFLVASYYCLYWSFNESLINQRHGTVFSGTLDDFCSSLFRSSEKKISKNKGFFFKAAISHWKYVCTYLSYYTYIKQYEQTFITIKWLS